MISYNGFVFTDTTTSALFFGTWKKLPYMIRNCLIFNSNSPSNWQLVQNAFRHYSEHASNSSREAWRRRRRRRKRDVEARGFPCGHYDCHSSCLRSFALRSCFSRLASWSVNSSLCSACFAYHLFFPFSFVFLATIE